MRMALLMFKHQHLFRRNGHGMERKRHDFSPATSQRSDFHYALMFLFFLFVAQTWQIQWKYRSMLEGFAPVFNMYEPDTYKHVRIENEDDDDCYANVIDGWKIYRYTHRVKQSVRAMPRPILIQFQEKSINTTDMDANKIDFVSLFFANNQRNEYFFMYMVLSFIRIVDWRQRPLSFSQNSRIVFHGELRTIIWMVLRNPSSGKALLTYDQKQSFLCWSILFVPLILSVTYSLLNWSKSYNDSIFGSTRNLFNSKIHRLNAMIGIQHKLLSTNNPNDHVERTIWKILSFCLSFVAHFSDVTFTCSPFYGCFALSLHLNNYISDRNKSLFGIFTVSQHYIWIDYMWCFFFFHFLMKTRIFYACTAIQFVASFKRDTYKYTFIV